MQMMLQQLCHCESVASLNVKTLQHFDVGFWDVLNCWYDALTLSSLNENTGTSEFYSIKQKNQITSKDTILVLSCLLQFK